MNHTRSSATDPKPRPFGPAFGVRGLLLLALVWAWAQLGMAAEPPSVAITQIVEHPSLDACRQGIEDELAAAGYHRGDNLRWIYESAQGNPGIAAQVAKKFAGLRPTVAVAISTPSAQTLAAAARSTPLVFSAVTDPVGAKLVPDSKLPGGRITGVSDLIPIARHMALVREIVPNASRLGVIFNPGEVNSVSLVQLVHRHAPQLGMSVIEAGATRSSDVLAAARSLVGRVDVIYLPTDNTVISALEAVLKVGEQASLPVIAGDTDSVGRGAIAALGFNYYDVGRQTGRMVVRVLEGESPGAIAVESVEKLDLFVNPAAANRMGVQLPSAILRRAKEIVR